MDDAQTAGGFGSSKNSAPKKALIHFGTIRVSNVTRQWPGQVRQFALPGIGSASLPSNARAPPCTDHERP
jgi:hypothetical protein